MSKVSIAEQVQATRESHITALVEKAIKDIALTGSADVSDKNDAILEEVRKRFRAEGYGCSVIKNGSFEIEDRQECGVCMDPKD